MTISLLGYITLQYITFMYVCIYLFYLMFVCLSVCKYILHSAYKVYGDFYLI